MCCSDSTTLWVIGIQKSLVSFPNQNNMNSVRKIYLSWSSSITTIQKNNNSIPDTVATKNRDIQGESITVCPSPTIQFCWVMCACDNFGTERASADHATAGRRDGSARPGGLLPTFFQY
jgi:hypothetical protein